MSTITNSNSASIARSDFIEILSDEFTGRKGFGVYAFLSCRDIENLYTNFLVTTMPARIFIRIFVRNF